MTPTNEEIAELVKDARTMADYAAKNPLWPVTERTVLRLCDALEALAKERPKESNHD